MSAVQTVVVPLSGQPPAEPRSITARPGRGDRTFMTGILFSGLAVLAIMAGVGIFLGVESLDSLRGVGLVDFLTTSEWQPDRAAFGIAAVMTGTVMIALVAVAASLPVSLGASLFIVEVAPPRVRSLLVAMVDLMAAVPSVVYGIWGLTFFQARVIGLSRWLSSWLEWIPFFKVDGTDASLLFDATRFTASTFIAGLVVALMVVPIQTSIMREVFSQVPAGEREGAFALGASRWGVIRSVSLPFGRGGVIGGTMLGLGRALGETIAVYLIISPRFDINFHVLEAGANSVSSLIALRFGEASGFGLSALMAAGLALFVLTLAVNFTASIFVARSRSGSSSEA